MRKLEAIAPCSYYGQLGGVLYGNNIGHFVVDYAFKRILDKHEDHLVKTQHKIVHDIKNNFAEQSKDLLSTVKMLSKRVSDLEKKVDKLNLDSVYLRMGKNAKKK